MGADKTELYIFSDGPKGEKDEEGVKEVRRVIRDKHWCKEVHIKEGPVNKGLANSLIAGITEVVNTHGTVIVVEDDLILSPQFLNYMNNALDTYADEERAMQVSGFMYALKGKAPETFFLRFPNCWGWATWKRAWQSFTGDTGLIIEKIREKGVNEFTLNSRLGSFQMLIDQHEGRIDSWAVRWYGSIFLKGGLVLYPRRSLVENIGLDGSGVHCKSGEVNTEMTADPILVERTAISEDAVMLKKVLDAKGPSLAYGLRQAIGDALNRIAGKNGPV
jgi:hypothetical protein